MAYIDCCGWEANSLIAEPVTAATTPGTPGCNVSGNASIESTIVRTGAASLKVNPASGVAGYFDTYTFMTIIVGTEYRQFYMRVTSLPATTARVIFGKVASVHIKINSSGILLLYDGATLLGTGTTALTDTGKWYRVALKVSNGSQELRVENNTEATGTVTSSYYCSFGSDDTVADTYTAYFDDFIISDSTWPPYDVRVKLLLPISDNYRDTLWTGGTGGTTNLWDAVNNTPPIGTATETNLTQIEHAGGSAGLTDRYSPNMETYMSKQITPKDKILAMTAWSWHGEDAGSGTKLLNLYMWSNPTTSYIGGDVAPTSGAIGTWRTGWWTWQLTTSLPTGIDYSASPVLGIVRPETATRVASVCFMGLYVAYQPGIIGSRIVNQSINRASTF